MKYFIPVPPKLAFKYDFVKSKLNRILIRGSKRGGRCISEERIHTLTDTYKLVTRTVSVSMSKSQSLYV